MRGFSAPSYGGYIQLFPGLGRRTEIVNLFAEARNFLEECRHVFVRFHPQTREAPPMQIRPLAAPSLFARRIVMVPSTMRRNGEPAPGISTARTPLRRCTGAQPPAYGACTV